MTGTVHILLPVHNRRETTRKFMDCLLAQTHGNYRLILIDDGSTDGTADMVRERLPQAIVLRGTGDWWWGGSLQQGLDRLAQAAPADDDIVLFINDDVSFGPEFLEQGVAALRSRPGTMLLARLADPATGRPTESGVHADFRRMSFEIAPTPAQINCLSTRGLFIRWEGVRKIGGFRPRLLPHYLSDYEFTIRGHRRGLACATCDSVFLGMEPAQTGFREFSTDGFARFVSRYFSKKSAANPFYWSAFMLMAAPWPWNVLNVARVWKGAGANLLRKALGS